MQRTWLKTLLVWFTMEMTSSTLNFATAASVKNRYMTCLVRHTADCMKCHTPPTVRVFSVRFLAKVHAASQMNRSDSVGLTESDENV